MCACRQGMVGQNGTQTNRKSGAAYTGGVQPHNSHSFESLSLSDVIVCDQRCGGVVPRTFTGSQSRVSILNTFRSFCTAHANQMQMQHETRQGRRICTHIIELHQR